MNRTYKPMPLLFHKTCILFNGIALCAIYKETLYDFVDVIEIWFDFLQFIQYSYNIILVYNAE